jgi:hypothetical protein
MRPLFQKADDLSRQVIINFHEVRLMDGIVRMILPGENREGETI